jgi:hypothetical protein
MLFTLHSYTLHHSILWVIFTTLSVIRLIEWEDIIWIMNWKGFGRKRSWPNPGIMLKFSYTDWGKQRWSSVRITVVRSEIRTEHLPCTNERLYCFTNPFGSKLLLDTANHIFITLNTPLYWDLNVTKQSYKFSIQLGFATIVCKNLSL